MSRIAHPLASLLAELGHPALAAIVERGHVDLAPSLVVELDHDDAIHGARRAILVEAVTRWGDGDASAELAGLVDGYRAVIDACLVAADVLGAVFSTPATTPSSPAAAHPGAQVIPLRRGRR